MSARTPRLRLKFGAPNLRRAKYTEFFPKQNTQMKSYPNRNGLASALLAGLLGLSAQVTHAATLSLNPNADTFVRFGVNQTSNFGTATYLDLFANTTIRDYFGYVRFDLSQIPVSATITAATLTFTKVDGLGSSRTDVITTARFRVLGLNETAGNTAQNWNETTLTFDSGRGSEWVSANTFDSARVTNFDGVAGNEVISSTGSVSKASISGTGLVAFLQSRLGTASYSSTFIVDQAGTEAGRGYGLATRERGSVDATQVPVLTIDYDLAAIPEPSTWAALAGLSGLAFAAGRRRRRAA